MCGFDNVVVVVVRRASVVPVSKNIEINFHLNNLFSMVIMIVVVVVNVIVVVLIVMIVVVIVHFAELELYVSVSIL